MRSLQWSILATLAFAFFVLHSAARNVTFVNNCTFPIDVETGGKVVVCTEVAALTGSCVWQIPTGGWSGNFHRKHTNATDKVTGYPSATLAELTFGNQSKAGENFNWDWFDISIIPPGCPGTVFGYQLCIDYSQDQLNDGYDVGMQMKSLSCLDKTRTCLDKNCTDAYGYPKDDTKTTVCKDIFGDWQVTFCPTGACVDLPGQPTTNCKYEVKTATPITSVTPSTATPITSASAEASMVGLAILACVLAYLNSEQYE